MDVTIKELTATWAGDVSRLVCNGSMIGQDQAILEKGRVACCRFGGHEDKIVTKASGESIAVVEARL